MEEPMKSRIRAVLAVGVLTTAVLSSCSSDKSSDTTAAGAETTAAAESVAAETTAAAAETTAASAETTAAATADSAATTGKKIKVGLVTDIGGLNDKGFNFLASEGTKLAESQLGATVEVRESKSDADYVPNLSYFAQQKFDLVIGVGFLMEKSLGDVAGQFPDVKFGIIDATVTSPNLAGHDNVAAISFHEEQGGYLNGYLAGLLETSNGLEGMNPDLVVGTVGGIKIPAVDRYIAGFQAGAQAAAPGIKTLNSYSNDFADQAKCKELAQAQIDQKADIVMQVAGGCGLGVFTAAEESKVYAMGGDTDQTKVAPVVIAAAQKKVDQAVLAVAKSVQDGTFAGGADTVLGVAEGGIEISVADVVPADAKAKVLEIQEQIRSGELKDIPATLP